MYLLVAIVFVLGTVVYFKQVKIEEPGALFTYFLLVISGVIFLVPLITLLGVNFNKKK